MIFTCPICKKHGYDAILLRDGFTPNGVYEKFICAGCELRYYRSVSIYNGDEDWLDRGWYLESTSNPLRPQWDEVPKKVDVPIIFKFDNSEIFRGKI